MIYLNRTYNQVWSVRVALNLCHLQTISQLQSKDLTSRKIIFFDQLFERLFNRPSSEVPIMIQYQMTNKAEIEKVQFHTFAKQPRLNNPTFISSFVNDSLTLFTPQKVQKQQNSKNTQYKSNFEPFADKKDIINLSSHYHKYSKDAFQKSRSYLSRYGTNLLSQSISNLGKK